MPYAHRPVCWDCPASLRALRCTNAGAYGCSRPAGVRPALRRAAPRIATSTLRSGTIRRRREGAAQSRRRVKTGASSNDADRALIRLFSPKTSPTLASIYRPLALEICDEKRERKKKKKSNHVHPNVKPCWQGRKKKKKKNTDSELCVFAHVRRVFAA